MKRIEPPYLLDCLLLFLLSPRDRETVSGDLLEEFLEGKLGELGPFRARLWYTRQVLSFVPARAAGALQPILRLVCFCTALAGGWLGMMNVLLRHPGSQIAIAATIVLQVALTFAALRFPGSGGLRAAAMLGSVAVLWIAGHALISMFGGADFEGYVLLIAVALIVQGALTLLILPKARISSGRRA